MNTPNKDAILAAFKNKLEEEYTEILALFLSSFLVDPGIVYSKFDELAETFGKIQHQK
jgi:hypothetical protein